MSDVVLEEVTGQGWVVDDEAGPQGSVEGRDDQWYEVDPPSRRMLISDKLPFLTRHKIAAQ